MRMQKNCLGAFSLALSKIRTVLCLMGYKSIPKNVNSTCAVSLPKRKEIIL